VRFWDTSAIVPLVVRQAESGLARDWLLEDGELAVWTLTSVELASAVYRLVREGAIPEEMARVAESRADALLATAHFVREVEAVKATASRLLRVHALRGADALQLASAMVWAGGDPRGLTVCAFDARLAPAALKEGFRVLPDRTGPRAG
jgi:uncharacterized protein